MNVCFRGDPSPTQYLIDMRHVVPAAIFLLAAWLLSGATPDLATDGTSRASVSNDELPMYYVIEPRVTVYRSADQSKPYLELQRRSPLYLIEENGEWSRVRTDDGAEGYVRKDAISNVWIRVSKRQQEVFVYRGSELLAAFPADFGFNAISDKERRGSYSSPDHWRTPEGSFYIVNKNPRSQFYKAFVLNYLTSTHAERGYRQGIISAGQRDAIIDADRRAVMPPMNTPLGGWIEIHGNGTGNRDNWTQGCVAIRNHHIDLMWSVVSVGTPVFIES